MTILFCASGLFAQEQGITFAGGNWKDMLAKAKAENKVIFMDAYATWCGPCKMMDKNVFAEASVGEFYNEHFVNAQIDMEAGEGIELTELYQVRPTLRSCSLTAMANWCTAPSATTSPSSSSSWEKPPSTPAGGWQA